ncbi:MAG: protein kinase, partial [Deltaproteobacteria bacterium]|nr:protein kinase [Deltaproteobacteria bacterium]
MLRDGSIIDGRYRLLDKIGAGGMGSVWLAEKLATYERFAIKFIHQHALGDDSYCARFSREVQVLRGLRHPNIVDVFDWSLPEPGRQPSAYVVMELLEGEPLQDVLKRRNRIPPGMVVRIMLQVLDGIAAVHEQGIVHRDLSPANIFLVKTPNPVPRVKILDFGLAKGLGHTNADSAVTQPGSVLGRAAYAAPEIFGDAELDTRADIFACGMIMFRALVGRFPYRETKVDLMWAERYSDRDKHDPYPPPGRFVGDVPAAVERIVVHALRRRPQERYQTATEMQKELLRADNLLPPSLRNITADMLLGASRATESSPSGSPTPGKNTGRGLGSTLLGTPPTAAGVPSLAATRRDEAAIASRTAPRAADAGHLATGPVVFGAQEEEVAAERTVMARVTETAVFTYSDPASAEAGSAADSPAASGGSQTSAAGDLAGDVASSIGAPALGRRSTFARRPAVVAFVAVMVALLDTVGILVLRGGGPDGATAPTPAATGAGETPGAPGVAEPETAPREDPAERPLSPPSPAVQAKPSVRPEPIGVAPLSAADAGPEEAGVAGAADAGPAETGTVATADAGTADAGPVAEIAPEAVATADGETGTGDGGTAATASADAARDPGTTVATVRDAGPETPPAARDTATGTVATARDAGSSTASRDAGAGPATARDAGTA